MTPKVSVLIPLYNCETYIGEAIESVVAQDYQDFEIIVVDDGSTDNSAEIVQNYPDVHYFYCEHSGIAKTRNYCLSKARGEFIAFLDSDDLWAKEKLSLQIQYMTEHPECDLVFCRYKNFTNINEQELNPRQRQILNAEIPYHLVGACLRRELFERFGLFNEKYSFGEDTEWIARLEIAGVDLGHKIDRFLYFRRIHDHNISETHQDMNEATRYSIYADAIRHKWGKKKK